MVRRLDLDIVKPRKPGLQTGEFVPIFGGITRMKVEQEPFRDLRVRRAMALATNWREVLETNAWSQGHGVPNPAVPAALREWSIPLVAHIASTIFGKFDKAAGGMFGAWTDPDSYLYRYYMPGQITTAGGINDSRVVDMIRLERRTFDLVRRRDIMYDIQRHLAQQAYVLYGPSASALAAWAPYVKNVGPNFGFDYGGRLMVAWLDK